MAMLKSPSSPENTIDGDVVYLETLSLIQPQPRPRLGVGSNWRLGVQATHHGRTRSSPCQWQEKGGRGRPRAHLVIPLHPFQPRAKTDHMVCQLDRLRMDHHHHHHCQLRCHGSRQQTTRGRQNRSFATNGKRPSFYQQHQP